MLFHFDCVIALRDKMSVHLTLNSSPMPGTNVKDDSLDPLTKLVVYSKIHLLLSPFVNYHSLVTLLHSQLNYLPLIYCSHSLHHNIYKYHKKKSTYSKTPLLRPPLCLRKNGLYSGVVLLLS